MTVRQVRFKGFILRSVLALVFGICLFAWVAAASQPPAKSTFPPRLTADLKAIAVMIADGKPEKEIIPPWEAIVRANRGLDIEAAIRFIVDEAKSLLAQNVQRARDRVNALQQLVDALGGELNASRAALAKAESGQSSINVLGKDFVVDGQNKLLVKPGEAIKNRTKLVDYIQALEQKLAAARDERQKANKGFQEADQRTNQLMQIMSTIIKTMRETAGTIQRGMG